MSTYRSTFTTRKGTGLTGLASYCMSCCVLCGIIVLLFIQSTLFSLPIASAASHDVTQQPENLARAGVSIVRIVAVYGPQAPSIVPSLPSVASTKTQSAVTSFLDNPLQTCTGLGVLVASKGSAIQQNAWVLTDGSLVNKNEFTCKSLGAASIISKQLTLNSISVYLSNAYNSTLSAAMTGEVKSVQCSDDRKCSNGVALFTFHASTLLPYAQLPNATSTPASESAAIQLSQSSQVTTPPTATTNLQQYLTPTSSLIQTSTPDNTNNFSGFESGTPIVDQSGFLTKMYLKDADATKVFKATDASAFLTKQEITSDPPPNDASSNWNSGISAFYQGSSHYDTAKGFFTKADDASSNQFQGAQAFVNTINTFQRTSANPSSTSATPENGVTLPILGFVSYLLLGIIIGGVILFVLLLILLNLLFKRGQRSRDFAEADKQATVQARQIQDMEAQQAAARSAPPRSQQPVPQAAPYPAQQQAAHGSIASRSSATPVAPAQAATSYTDYPTIDMGEARRNGMLEMDTTQPFSQNVQRTDTTEGPMGFEVITSTDPGIKRQYKPNEDSLFAVKGTRMMNGQTQQVGLFVVADGMGGHANGQDASRLAIQTIIDYILPRLFHGENANETPEKLLVDSVQQANQAVHEHNMANSADMGTTVTATLIIDTIAHVANVGDSRTYLYRTAEGLSKVTRDHSVVASLVDAGIIKPDDIYTHPKRNQIYRSLGEKPFVEVDPFEVQLQPGDKMLLCSDGLWDMVRDPEIQHVLEMPITDPQQLGDNLVKAAHVGGGEDNISVIVINVVVRAKPLSPELNVIYRQENVHMPSV